MSNLHFLARKAHLAELFHMISTGADLEARDDHNRTALFVAAECGAVEGVRALIAAGASLEAVSGHQGQTALCGAAASEEFETCAELLRAGAKPTADAHGFTPLHLAASGPRKLLELLLAAGCLADQKNVNGETPADCADRQARAGWGHVMENVAFLRDLERVARAEREGKEIAAELAPGIAGPRLRM